MHNCLHRPIIYGSTEIYYITRTSQNPNGKIDRSVLQISIMKKPLIVFGSGKIAEVVIGFQ